MKKDIYSVAAAFTPLLGAGCAAMWAKAGVDGPGLPVILLCVLCALLPGLLIGKGIRKGGKVLPCAFSGAAALCFLLAVKGGFGVPAADVKTTLLHMLFPALSAIFCIIAAFPGISRDMRAMASLPPVFLGGFILLMFYRSCSTNPYPSAFILEVLCIIAVLLGLYGAASRFFLKPMLRTGFYQSLGLFGIGFILCEAKMGAGSFPAMSDMYGYWVYAAFGALVLMIGAVLCPASPEEAPQAEETAASEENEIQAEEIK